MLNAQVVHYTSGLRMTFWCYYPRRPCPLGERSNSGMNIAVSLFDVVPYATDRHRRDSGYSLSCQGAEVRRLCVPLTSNRRDRPPSTREARGLSSP